MNAIAQLQPKSSETADPAVLSAAFDACTGGLVLIESGRVLYANPAFARLLGYLETAEVQGQALTDLMPGLLIPRDAAQVRPGSGFPVREISCTRKDGTPIQIEASSAHFGVGGRDADVVSVRDITQSQLTELQVREAQKMEAIGRLVGGVAHDFNNLLTGIVLCCDLLLSGLDRKSRLRHYAEEIRMAGAQSAGLIQQLLEVARQRVVEPRLLSFNETISGMRNLLARLIGENIELVTELADDLGAVKIDPALVQQIILNLVLNARDAMPEGGRITLTTRNYEATSNTTELASGVELAVADTGCGMDAETRSRLFEPFFTTKKPGRGNGLGLATVYSIVKQDGGTIEVESEPEKGTQVMVRLPRAEAESKPPEMAEVANQSNPASSKKSQHGKRGKSA